MLTVFNSRRLDLFIVAAIVLLAAFFRLYRLDQLPPGLHFDEAFNATMAQRVLSGVERPIYFTEDLTEEPMAIYITALAFGIFGASPWSIRLVSALAGIATVAALYFLARVLFQSRWTAALATFVLAILYWHINFSRLGMEPIFVPLTMTLAFGFLWRAMFSPQRGGGGLGWGGAGIFLAATQYTYKAALFVPVLFILFIASEILIDRKFWTRHGRGLVICVIIAVLVFAPLGL
jgi:4-amino-4-deoxy-L-arabinose transferase-like glycosyltransferase